MFPITAGPAETAFLRLSLLSVLPERNMYTSIAQLITWLRAVESPAPAMPMCRPNIRMGSPAMFKMAPVIRPIIPREAFPS